MPTEITLRFTYTQADHTAAMRLFYIVVRKLRVKPNLIGGAAGIVIGVVCTIVWGADWFWTFLICAGAFLLLIMLAALVVFPRVFFRREPQFHHEHLLKFSESGIEHRTTGIDSRLEWSVYNRLVEDEKAFVLIYGKDSFTAIPKRVFADKDEEAAFRELASSKIQSV